MSLSPLFLSHSFNFSNSTSSPNLSSNSLSQFFFSLSQFELSDSQPCFISSKNLYLSDASNMALYFFFLSLSRFFFNSKYLLADINFPTKRRNRANFWAEESINKLNSHLISLSLSLSLSLSRQRRVL